MGTKKTPGKYDCLATLGDDEPFFVLRAQDILSAQLVTDWAIRAQLHGVNPHKIAEARACAQAMREWPQKKVPD